MMITGRPLTGVTTRESLERVAHMVDVPAFRRRQVRVVVGDSDASARAA